MKTPTTTAPIAADTTPQDRYRWRTYQFEVQGVDPWAVVPLVKRVRELVAHHGAGELEYEWDTEVEVQIKFKARETTEEPKFAYPWGNQMDDELMLGFGWRCLLTTFADGSTIDETEAAAQRRRAVANGEKP